MWKPTSLLIRLLGNHRVDRRKPGHVQYAESSSLDEGETISNPSAFTCDSGGGSWNQRNRNSNAAQQAFDTVMCTITYSDNSSHSFHAAAIASAILGVYCLKLPKTAPPVKAESISLSKVLGY